MIIQSRAQLTQCFITLSRFQRQQQNPDSLYAKILAIRRLRNYATHHVVFEQIAWKLLMKNRCCTREPNLETSWGSGDQLKRSGGFDLT